MFTGWFRGGDEEAALRERVQKLQKELDDAHKAMHAILARLMSLERYVNAQYQPPSVMPGAHVKTDIGPKKTDGRQ